MPVVEPGSDRKVLVTGANGFIAMWVVKTLLDEGYSVRGVVRSEAKGARLREFFKDQADRFELAIVEDIMKDGAFDEVVKDVDAIEHMASPLPGASEDPEDFIQPAVLGTLGILRSAMKYGTNVKRIVLTSSVGAIVGNVGNVGNPVIFDETNWADDSVDEVKKLGVAASMTAKYRASKTLAERAAWEFCKNHKQEIKWELVAINPSVVLGPCLQGEASPDRLTVSLAQFYDTVFKPMSDEDLKISYNYVDVRDVAAAHIKSLQSSEAAGERMIVSKGGTTRQETRNCLRKLFPDLYEQKILPMGNPGLVTTLQYVYNEEKGRRILGIMYRDIDTILRDTVSYFQGRGWIQQSTTQ